MEEVDQWRLNKGNIFRKNEIIGKKSVVVPINSLQFVAWNTQGGIFLQALFFVVFVLKNPYTPPTTLGFDYNLIDWPHEPLEEQEMAADIVFDTRTQSIRNLAWWLYIFHGASLVFAMGALSWIPLIISYLKRPDAAGTFVYSHHTWQIRSFWWYLAWMAVGWLFFISFVGIPLALLVWGLAWLWKAYRLIKGLLNLSENKPMPV